MQVTIIGTGLIGGSIAKAIRNSGFASAVIGYDRNEIELQLAVSSGVIDRYSLDIGEAVSGSDLIVLAVPVLATTEVLGELKNSLNESSIVTDVGSSKGAVVAAARSALGSRFSRFVPGHPIAGKEKSGVVAADADLFKNHRIILTPIEETAPDAVATVTQMWESTGAEVKCLGVLQHDLVLGATSHLPHVLAYATVDTLAASEYVDKIFDFAAGGFRDFTRIASSDPIMWRDICLTNKDAILDVMDQFEKHIQSIRQLIASEDSEGLLKTFDNAKRIRDTCLKRSS